MQKKVRKSIDRIDRLIDILGIIYIEYFFAIKATIKLFVLDCFY